MRLSSPPLVFAKISCSNVHTRFRMDKRFVIVLCIGCTLVGVIAAPKMRIIPEQIPQGPLFTLPANYTNIRADVSDTFSCEGKSYGYYADVDNDCQVFHICLPIEGRNYTYRWSFICPGETIFNQESFTCARIEDAVKCNEAPNFYKLNDNFGLPDEVEDTNNKIDEDKTNQDANESDVPPINRSIDEQSSSDNQRNSRGG